MREVTIAAERVGCVLRYASLHRGAVAVAASGDRGVLALIGADEEERQVGLAPQQRMRTANANDLPATACSVKYSGVPSTHGPGVPAPSMQVNAYGGASTGA